MAWQKRSWLAFVVGLSLTVCSHDEPRLELVKSCSSDDECVDADDRYDRCAWVCEGDSTYCIVSCETDADCVGRGLPHDWVYCDIPRPGDGFCNKYGFDYAKDACKQDVGAVAD